jgi:hypothetical protein
MKKGEEKASNITRKSLFQRSASLELYARAVWFISKLGTSYYIGYLSQINCCHRNAKLPTQLSLLSLNVSVFEELINESLLCLNRCGDGGGHCLRVSNF